MQDGGLDMGKRELEYYATLGPSSKDGKVMEEMFRVGMTGVRVNTSHSTLEEMEDWLAEYFKAAKKCGVKEPKLLMDLQGPELRIGKIPKGISLKEKKKIRIGKGGIKVPKAILANLKKGREILLDDGMILLMVKKCEENYADCIVLRGGKLESKKSITLPGIKLDTPTLTKTDLENISRIQENKVTGVMLPFVRSGQDVKNLRDALKQEKCKDTKIYAKIENLAGMECIEEVAEYADEIVIARGDLGNDMPLWELPAAQKKIATVCRKKEVPFLVATQLMHTMEENGAPSRAEVLDVYNCVLDGASGLMLTGETAKGKHPVSAMGYMVNTAKEALR